MIKNKIHPDPLLAVEFVVWLSAGSTIYLEQMASQGSPNPKAKTYAVGDKKSAVSFVSTNNASDLQRNIYFFPNAEFLDGKRLKENLKAVRHLHVDLDHKDYPGTENEQSDRILSLLLDEKTRPKGIPIPSAVWFTGGGYQAVWMLQLPLEVEEAEELNKAILITLQGGAGTHNADRLLRLPWTMNWLNDSKRRLGARQLSLSLWSRPGWTFRRSAILAISFQSSFPRKCPICQQRRKQSAWQIWT
jgi:hypothetical protein